MLERSELEKVILEHPKTVKELASYIIVICDLYWGRKISEKDSKYYINSWANGEGKKLFDGPRGYNKTIVKIVGKRRIELINKWLEGTQTMINI